MSMGQYILDANGEPQLVNDVLEWGRWMQTANRHVGRDKIGDVDISTVFLGLDHSFGAAKPVLYETMIFGGKHDQYQERYHTREEAVKGHQKAIDLVRTT